MFHRNNILKAFLPCFCFVLSLILSYDSFSLIQSILTEGQRTYRIIWFSITAVSLLITILFAVLYAIKKLSGLLFHIIGALIGLSYIVSYIYLVFGIFSLDGTVSVGLYDNIPLRMVSSDMIMLPGILGLIVLLYHIVASIVLTTEGTSLKDLLKNILYTILLPLFIWMLFKFIPSDFDSADAIVALVMIIFSAFVYLLLKSFYIISVLLKNLYDNRINRIFWIIIALVLPLAGLLLNGFPAFWGYGLSLDSERDAFYNNVGVFGDFSHHLYRGLVVLNFIVFYIPFSKHPTLRYIHFALQVMTTLVITYFGLVLLPFLPLLFVAIVGFGAGLLGFVPFVLLFLQCHKLYNAALPLYKLHKVKLWIASIAGIGILPICLISYMYYQKYILSDTIESVFSRDFSERIPVYSDNDIGSILSFIVGLQKDNDSRDGGVGIMGIMTPGYQPYITSIFSRIVLNNHIIADDKISLLQDIYQGKEIVENSLEKLGNNNRLFNADVVISSLDYTTKGSLTVIEGVVKNNDSWNREFIGYIELPKDVFVTDFAMQMSGVMEHAMIAERKSATRIYNSIVREQRDPGIINYKDPYTLQFKLFPIPKGQEVKWSISFVHSGDISIISKGNNTISLSKKDNNETLALGSGSHYYFIVHDRDEEMFVNNQLLIKSFIEKHALDFNQYSVVSADINYNIYSGSVYIGLSGGEYGDRSFYADRPLKAIIRDHYINNKSGKPYIIFLEKDRDQAIVYRDFIDFLSLLPDPYYYTIDANSLYKYSFIQTGVVHSGFIYDKSLFDTTPWEIDHNTYISGYSKLDDIFKTYSNYLLYPSGKQSTWEEIVKDSIQYKLLTPLTTFIVLENQAQKDMLKRKQKQILEGKYYHDIENSEEFIPMSEPYMLFFMLPFFFLLFFKKEIV